MTKGEDQDFAAQMAHELRQVIVGLQATRRLLLRNDHDSEIMIRLQGQAIERLQVLIGMCYFSQELYKKMAALNNPTPR